jgi:hypothetical protein
MSTISRQFSLCLCTLFVGLNVVNGISIDGHSTTEHDRFDNSSSFIAYSFDLSGIGIADSGRWLTMVSPKVFLSAHHFFPADDVSVTFYTGNDPNGSSLTRTVSYSERIGSSDLRIGYLDQALSANYAHYDIASASINNLTNFSSTYYDTDAYLFGRSPSSFTVSQDMAVGRNKLDSFATNQEANGTTDHALIAYNNVTGESNFLTDEALLQTGDSGAPMMVENAGSLTLVGINWFIGTDSNNDPLNGFSYVGNYNSDIETFINANPVPELSATGIYMALFLMTLGIGSRRISLKLIWSQY